LSKDAAVLPVKEYFIQYHYSKNKTRTNETMLPKKESADFDVI